MNIFGLILSIFILLTCIYIVGLIFFNSHIDGYIRVAICTIGILGIIYYIMFIMQTFWS